jgi:type II secretory pathway pseudopilin PulG
MLMTEKGMAVRVHTKDLSVIGRNTQGYRLVRLEEGDKLSILAPVVAEDEVGLLAAIAIPKFGGMLVRAKEAKAKARLGSLRSAVSIYTADMEGRFPEILTGVVPNHISMIPEIGIPSPVNHGDNNANRATLNDWASDEAWVYNSATGKLFINCTHTDTKGSTWSTF